MQSFLIAVTLTAAAIVAQAQVTVQAPWVRATVAQQKATGVFMQLTALTATRVVSVSSPLASHAEMHEMSMQGSTMKMRAIAALDLPAGQTVALQPGGYHIMLMGLKSQVKPGDDIPITLVLEAPNKTRSTLDIKARARALGAAAEHMH